MQKKITLTSEILLNYNTVVLIKSKIIKRYNMLWFWFSDEY